MDGDLCNKHKAGSMGVSIDEALSALDVRDPSANTK